MKRRLTLCMILVFAPLLLALSYGMSRQSFTLSMEQEMWRTQILEGVIAAEIRSKLTEELSYEGLQRLATQYRNLYSAQQLELIFLYNGYPLDGSKLPNRYYDGLFSGQRSALLDTRSKPELYAIADPLSEYITLLLLQNVSPIYALRSQMQQAFLLWGLGGCAVVTVLSWLIASWFTRPVKGLLQATRQLSQSAEEGGEECIALPLHRKDELGNLAKSFQTMQEAVRGRETALFAEAAGRQALLEALAHEMRTPLCSLLGNTRLLENPGLPIAQRNLVLSRMAQEIKRLADMDEQLLKLVDMRHGDIEQKPVFLLTLLQDTALRLESQAEGVALRVEGAAESSVIQGDSALLSLMADNLAVNALRASAHGQQVILCAHENGFSIIDEGIGMTEEQLSRAFEAFYKGDPSRTRSAGGAGLGLSLCQKIAELHGGALVLSSVPGKGTTATFTTLLQPVADLVTASELS